MGEKTKIRELHENGYIRERGPISFLTEQLGAQDPDIREMAARAVIEEVVGGEFMKLRLRALDTLLQLPRRETATGSTCRGQIDLHTHSAAFDGYQTSTALILEAFERGLAAVAITDHNKPPFDDNLEAEWASQRLGVCFYKGSEISADFPSEGTQLLQTVHLLEIPARPPKSSRALVKRYTRDFSGLGVVSDLVYPLIRRWALLYTDHCTRKQVQRMLDRVTRCYGQDLAVSPEDMRKVCRGDLPIPFTIALALWRKYRQKLAGGFEISLAEGRKTIEPLASPHEVYRRFLTHPNGGRTHKRKKGPPPDLFAMGQLALLMEHKLILAHPNEYSIDLFEEAIEKAALVRMKDGKRFAGVFIGVEYYSHKLQGDWKEYVGQYVAWLNRVHPVYRNFPLRFFPGSDTHGKFSPERPLGLRSNYPADQERYNRELQEALVAQPREIAGQDGERLDEDLKAWKHLRAQRPPELQEVRRRLSPRYGAPR